MYSSSKHVIEVLYSLSLNILLFLTYMQNRKFKYKQFYSCFIVAKKIK